MRTRTRRVEVAPDEVEAWLAPHHAVVEETEGVTDGATTVFRAERSVAEDYERRVTRTDLDDGRVALDIEVTFRLRLGPWTPFFLLPTRRALLARPRESSPWWAPPDALDTHGGAALASLASLSIIAGYLGTLVTQTITFVAEEFEASERQQGDTLAAVRVGVLLALVITGWADRNGRRRALIWTAVAGCIATALAAVTPGLVAFGATQTIARGLATTLTLLITVMVAEEMPAGSRAYGVSLLTMSGALGAGMALWALPIADLDVAGWRVLYALPLVFLPLVWWTAPRLPESRRYERVHAEVSFRGHMGRLWLLASSGFLLALFFTPAAQLQNEYLRDEEGFSAAQLSLFTVATATPGGIGIVVGGRLADVRGRRLIGAIGLGGGAVFTAARFLTTGPPLWITAVLAAIVGGMTVPALGVYGPELFPTSLRSRANAVITLVGVAGSAAGLLVVGRLAERWELSSALVSMAFGPAIVVVLVLALYPETAHRELEELNPEDDIPTPPTATLGGFGV